MYGIAHEKMITSMRNSHNFATIPVKPIESSLIASR